MTSGSTGRGSGTREGRITGGETGGGTVGLLLAAGHGRRFDPTGRRFKLAEPLDGEPIALRTCRALLAACDRVIAVVREPADPLARALAAAGATLAVVTATAATEGMGHSIATGARAIAAAPGADRVRAVLVLPADMPWVASATIARIAGAAVPEGTIVVPVFDGQDGHPVRFPGALLGALAGLAGDRGARPLLAAHPVRRLVVDDDGIIRDVDRPDDLG